MHTGAHDHASETQAMLGMLPSPCHDDCQWSGGNVRIGLVRGVTGDGVPERVYDTLF
jgi:hypothetical protein